MSSYSQIENWGRLEAIFYEALNLPGSERAAYLTQACADEPELRKEVEELLSSSEHTIGFLANPIEKAAQVLVAQEELSGQKIGQYRILHLLGEGGMGKVYLADRADDQYEHQVAIKVMSGLLCHNRAMLLRFRSERQILADLDHPNIAQLLDGGVTTDGSPYLVMEYVNGTPLDEYCNGKNLSIDDRLRLFCKVCSAVEYAHHHLVVHRDIKPANILVNAEGEPKLLDFGIAKFLDESQAAPSVNKTRSTEYLMTPEYASPEQVRGDPVSTSTDVYGLGALLYELLSGCRPFKFETRSALEVARIICEKDPEPPSARARANPPLSVPDLKKLGRDLDNIVLKAMRKEAAKRYVSATLLCSDVQAFLDGYPVTARGNAWRYRAGKFVRRHTAGVAIAALSILALIGFSIAMGMLARRANIEQQKAQRESEFLAGMFKAASPNESRGHEITARDLLDRGAERIDKELAAEPQVRTSLLLSIAGAYSDLGAYDRGLNLLKKTFSRNDWARSITPLDRASALNMMATLYRQKGDYKTADPFFRQALAIRRKLLGGADLQVVESLTNLGECLYLEGSEVESESLLRRALAIRRQQNPDDGSDVRNYLALLLERKGEIGEAAQLLGEAVAISRQVDGADSPNYATILHNLASALIDLGDLKQAESRLRDALDIRRKVLGKGHPSLAYSLNNLGYVFLAEGEWPEAGPFLKENLAICVNTYGAGSGPVAPALNNWARYLQAKGDYAEAEKEFNAAMRAAEKNGGENWTVAQIRGNLGVLEFDRGHYAKAERLGKSALAMQEKLGAKDTPAVASSLLEIGLDRLYEGDAATAESLFRRALAIRRERLKPGHPAIINAAVRLGEALLVESKMREAGPPLKEAFELAHASPFPLPEWEMAEADAAYHTCLKAEGASYGKIRFHPVALRNDPRPALRVDPGIRLADLRRRWTAYAGRNH